MRRHVIQAFDIRNALWCFCANLDLNWISMAALLIGPVGQGA